MSALIERVSLVVQIPRPDPERLAHTRPPEPSARVAERVREGSARQQARFAGAAHKRNADMDHAQILRFCQLDPSAQKLSQAASRQLHLSVRSTDGMLAVARTIADLAGSDQIQANHLAEAIQYQPPLSLREWLLVK